MNIRLLPCMALFGFCLCSAFAATTVDPANPFAYGANIGWVNAEADVANGAVVGEFYCSGYLYSANCGWIFLGDGSPSGGQHYSNTTPGQCGVNHDGQGRLYGYAYGANIGWIGFEQTYGKPGVDFLTGELSGCVWSANAGWIDLTGLKTLVIDLGNDVDADGIADAWEFHHVGFSKFALAVLSPTNDWDADGVSDLDEYMADSDPMDSNDYFCITGFFAEQTTNWISWPARASRVYELRCSAVLSNGMDWTAALPPLVPSVEGEFTAEVADITNHMRFYRARVRRGPVN